MLWRESTKSLILSKYQMIILDVASEIVSWLRWTEDRRQETEVDSILSLPSNTLILNPTGREVEINKV